MKSTLTSIKYTLFSAMLILTACGGGSDAPPPGNNTVLALCEDSLDNDADGLTDFPADPGCASASDNDETDPVAAAICADGIDNDTDGLIDFPNDPGCASTSDNDETDTIASTAHTADRANSYDDAWEAAWVNNAKNIIATPVTGITKTIGKVLHVGDSMTFSNAYGDWARSGAGGGSSSDLDTNNWMHSLTPGVINGWTFSTKSTTSQNNIGWGNALVDNIFTDTSLNDAQIAVVMFNAPFITTVDMSIVQQRVDEFIAAGIVPVLSTIPPRIPDPSFDFNTEIAIPYNAALRSLAETNSLPIIDFYEEILLRRPGDTWIYALIGVEALGDGVHPSGGINGYTPVSDPYADGGDPATHTTGNAALNSGYLLRTWLTLQKIKEIKQKVID